MFPSRSRDWIKFERNNETIVLNILFAPYNTKQIRQAYISKYNEERGNQVNLLMINDGTNNWHYYAVISISELTKGITSNHNGDLVCLNCFHSYRTEKKLKKYERICKEHNFCNTKMSIENNNSLKYNSGEKSLKVPSIIYAGIDCLLQKKDTCQNNSKKSCT